MDMSQDPVSRRRWAGFGIVVAAILAVVVSGFAVEIGSMTITLQSNRYYKQWDLTRLVYRVKGSEKRSGESWILAVGACVTEDVIEAHATSSFAWTEEPFRGMEFRCSKTNERFEVWLVGQWEVGSTQVAAAFGGPSGDSGEVSIGAIDGPVCEGASISIETLAGASVGFPALSGPGTYEASGQTLLRVTSTSTGWSLSESLGFAIPEGASESVVARVLVLSYDPFSRTSGVTDVRVGYVLDVSEADFEGLPEGSYRIEITYTVSTD